MDNDLDQLKSDPGIIRLYSQYLKLKKEGDRYSGCCPIHKERNPSFSIFKDGMWTCFSGCGNGNIFQFIQKMDNCDFKAAAVKVREFLGKGESKWERQKEQVEAVFRPVVDNNKTFKVFTLDQYWKYEENLLKSQPALDWLASRGISPGTAQRLHTGYRQDIGNLAGERNKHLADQGWLSFPCIQGDKVVSIKYRSVVEKAFSKQSGMETALYNTDTIDVFEDVLLVEGEPDALILEQAGFHAVSLASASSHPTPQQKDMLMKASRVFLAGDCDGAVGEVIMNKLWRELEERTYLLKWPDGMKDANQTFLEKCKGDVSLFQTEMARLVHDAVKQPLPDVYSLKEVMVSSQQGSLVDHPLRLRFPQPDVDKMAILLPGSVWGIYATQTGMGKTPFIIQTTMHNALHYGARVLVWQCELSPEEISTIVTAQILKKDRNTLTIADKHLAAEMLGDVGYYIGHNPSITDGNQVLDLIEAAIRRLSITHVVLDTFNNLVVSETNGTAIETALSNRIKNTSMKHKTIWGNVYQPRKAQQQARGKKTHITDIRGAASAADTCDAVFAMHRDLAKSPDDSPMDDIYESRTLIQAQKTRAKGTGKSETYLEFFGSFASFEQIDYTHPEA